MRIASNTLWNLVSIFLISALLCACGGGNSEATEAVLMDTARLNCQVVDSVTGLAVAAAKPVAGRRGNGQKLLNTYEYCSVVRYSWYVGEPKLW